jgi:hypothetical protein
LIIERKAMLRKIPSYTFLGCPMTKNRSPWCFRLCAPDAASIGRCGRIAPHALRSRIQIGIDEFKSEHCDLNN